MSEVSRHRSVLERLAREHPEVVDPFDVAELLHRTFHHLPASQRKGMYAVYLAILADRAASSKVAAAVAAPAAALPAADDVGVAPQRDAADSSRGSAEDSNTGTAEARQQSGAHLAGQGDDGGAQPPTGTAAETVAVTSPEVAAPSVSSSLVQWCYILLDERCPTERLPTMRRNLRCRPAPSVVDGNATLTAAWRDYLRAEDVLDGGQVGDEWYAASEHFRSAAKWFSAERDHAMAGNCHVRAADCFRCLVDTDAAVNSLADAAESFAAGHGTPEALRCYTQAIFLSLHVVDRPCKAAKLCRRAAEVATTGGAAEDALDFLCKARDIYREQRLFGEARAAMTRAVAVSIHELGSASLAITHLEALADVSIPSEQPLVLFRAMLCRIACLPPEIGKPMNDALSDCEYMLDQYTDLCVELCGGAENRCLKAVLRGLVEHNPRMVEEALDYYRETHSLEPYIKPLMEMIVDGARQREVQQQERLRSLPR